jgi:GT2 family glycosyltransferase
VSKRVCVVVLNWNKPDDTIECLDSCLKMDYPDYEIILVDNHSSDDSVARVRSRFPNLEIVENAENLGYAGGNNAGIKRALEKGADHVFLLNNDVTVDKNVLTELVSVFVRYPKAGIVAPKVLYYDDPAVINSMGTSMDWLKLRPKLGHYQQRDDVSHPEVMEKEILLGAALMLSRRLLQTVGLIDEKFFIFHEEADWCFRSRRSGFDNLTASKARIYHKESKTMREFSTLTHYYSTRNFLYFTRKNATPAQWLATRAGLLYLSAKHAAKKFSKEEKDRRMAAAYFSGIWDYCTGKMGKCQRGFGK